MNLRDLECFFALADELHFGRAAAAMYVAQSTLSEAISRLERDVGGELFHRTTRRVDLTPLGEMLLRDGRAAYDELARAYEQTRVAARRQDMELRIGYTLDARNVLHALVRALDAAEVDVVPLAIMMTSPELVVAVRQGQLDAAICWVDQVDSELTSVPLDTRHLVAAVATRSKFARCASVTREQLEHEPLIRMARDHSPLLFDALVTTSPNVELLGMDRGGPIDNLLARVLSGSAVGVLVDSTAELYPVDGITYIRIADAIPVVRRLLWRATNHKRNLSAIVDAASTTTWSSASDVSAEGPV